MVVGFNRTPPPTHPALRCIRHPSVRQECCTPRANKNSRFFTAKKKWPKRMALEIGATRSIVTDGKMFSASKLAAVTS